MPIEVIMLRSAAVIRNKDQIMRTKNFFIVATIFGWLIFTFSTPAIIAGVFIVLGTAQPWGLVVPSLFLTFGWLLTRLDFHEVYWKKTLGIFIVTWVIVGIITTLLIISRTGSPGLTYGALPVLYCLGVGGLLLTTLSPARVKSSPA